MRDAQRQPSERRFGRTSSCRLRALAQPCSRRGRHARRAALRSRRSAARRQQDGRRASRSRTSPATTRSPRSRSRPPTRPPPRSSVAINASRPTRAGRRLGKAISVSDHARIQLHRLANTQRFVVWRVSRRPMKKTAIILRRSCRSLSHRGRRSTAAGDGFVSAGFRSSTAAPEAGAGAQIDVHEQHAGPWRNRSQPTSTRGSRQQHVVEDDRRQRLNAPSPPQPLYPPLPASSPLLQKTQPYGPGSFWYQDGAGHVCEYVPGSTGLCFTITGTATARPPRRR